MKLKIGNQRYSLDELAESFFLEDVQSVLLGFLRDTVVSENIIDTEKDERETIMSVFEIMWKAIEAHYKKYNKIQEKRYLQLIQALPKKN